VKEKKNTTQKTKKLSVIVSFEEFSVLKQQAAVTFVYTARIEFNYINII